MGGCNLSKLLPVTRVKSVKGLFARSAGIESIGQVVNINSYRHLQKLDLSGNAIKDLSGLLETTRLTGLYLDKCQLSSFSHVLSVVKKLVHLKQLDLRFDII